MPRHPCYGACFWEAETSKRWRDCGEACPVSGTYDGAAAADAEVLQKLAGWPCDPAAPFLSKSPEGR